MVSRGLPYVSVSTGLPYVSVITGLPYVSVSTGLPYVSVSTGLPYVSVSTGLTEPETPWGQVPLLGAPVPFYFFAAGYSKSCLFRSQGHIARYCIVMCSAALLRLCSITEASSVQEDAKGNSFMWEGFLSTPMRWNELWFCILFASVAGMITPM